MKLLIDKTTGDISVRLTKTLEGGDTTTIPVSTKENLKNWYPFNINYQYVYSESQGRAYLKELGKSENNSIARPLITPLGSSNLKFMEFRNKNKPYNSLVSKRNKYIISRAKSLLKIKTIEDVYVMKDLDVAFERIGKAIDSIKNGVEERLVKSEEIPMHHFYSEEGFSDTFIMKNMTKDEQELLWELGEMYSMLVLMKKLIR